MHFLRISTSAFGPLRDLDTGPEPLPGLVVVEGRNEAGKSTFFELLSTALYGFYPASREGHPYSPWDGGVAEVRGTLRLRNGGEVEVMRRLLSSPQGSLVEGDREEELRNRTLPMAEHVPRPVFRHVFALTLGELAGLEGESWEAVQDRLIGAMGASDLRSAREVVEALAAEAGRLWRPSRRGSQEIRDLEDRVRELQRQRQAAAAQESEIRELSVELAGETEELARAREEREADRIYLDRYSRLLPVRDQLTRIEELRREAGDSGVLEELPGDPRARLAELEARQRGLEERREELEEAAVEPREVVAAFQDRDRRLVEHEEAVEALVADQAGLEPVRVRVAQLEQDLRDLGRRFESRVQRLVDRNADEGLREVVRSLPVEELRDRARRKDELRAEVDELARPETDAAPTVPGEPPLWVPLLPLAAGLVALATTPLAGSQLLTGIGIALLGAGLVLGYLWYRARRERRSAEVRREERSRELARRLRDREEELARAEERLSALVAPLSPGPGAPDPDGEWAREVTELVDLVRDEDDRRRALAEERQRIRDVEEAGEALRELLPEEDRRAGRQALSHLLGRALRAAVNRRDAAAAARRELQRIEREAGRIAEEETETAEARAGLERRLRSLGAGDLERGAAEAEARLAARDRARQIQDELERTHPRLDELRARIREAEAGGEEWVADPEALDRRRLRVEALSGEIEDRLRRVQALEKDLERLGERTTLDELDGEILEVEERIRRLSEERDRLWILSRIVQEGERRIRDEHQPAILREASVHLSRLTGGRYDRLLLAGRDGRSFRVQGPAAPVPLPIEPPLSSGTREQIYLALRVSVLDQLDRSGERLPLLLDEVLVNWDPERRRAGLELVARIARERQIFFFTCHPGMAEELQELGGRRIELDRS